MYHGNFLWVPRVVIVDRFDCTSKFKTTAKYDDMSYWFQILYLLEYKQTPFIAKLDVKCLL
jgi:hypothetical protein